MAESEHRSYRDSAVGRSPEKPRAQADDPLAELARFIGQSVPMNREAGQDRRSTARATYAAQDEIVGEPHDDQHSAPDESRYEQDFKERYELANEERYDRSVHADPPPFIRSSRNDREADFASAVADDLHDFIGDDRDETAYNEAEIPSSDPRDDHYGHDEYDHEAHGHSDDHAYGEEYEDFNEALNTRRRSGFVLVAMIFGLAVLGTAGVFAYRAMFGAQCCRHCRRSSRPRADQIRSCLATPTRQLTPLVKRTRIPKVQLPANAWCHARSVPSKCGRR